MTTDADVLIRGGTVIDGTGAPAFGADIAVKGERIVAVGDLSGLSAASTVDAAGRVVAPGFIDVHTHDDRLLLENPAMTPKATQGVTTVAVGNCGVSLAPYRGAAPPPPPMNLLGGLDWYRFEDGASYLAALADTPAALNALPLCGHSSLRASVMDDLGRAATAREIDAMARLLDETLDAGFAGLSTGLAYPTAEAAPTEEVVELARVAAAKGGIHTSHMRDEEDHVTDAIEETVAIGRAAHIPSVISHHKTCGRQNYGRTRETLAMIAEAQADLALDIDVYPYIASSTVLLESFTHRADKVLITWSVPHPEMTGRALDDIEAEWGVSCGEAIDRLNPAGAVYFQMDEDDLRRVMCHPGAMIGSDGLPHDPKPHPRLWGTFPRVLGHYARDEKLFPLEEAVHRMTGKTASVFGLVDRGTIRAGAFADITIFDAAAIRDVATFEDPIRPAEGIDRVMTNGAWILIAGRDTGNRPGRALRRG